jgi:hypothetical protein
MLHTRLTHTLIRLLGFRRAGPSTPLDKSFALFVGNNISDLIKIVKLFVEKKLKFIEKSIVERVDCPS